MAENAENAAAVESTDGSQNTEAAATEATEAATTTEGESALGDAGKKALDAMKAKWKEAESKAKAEAEARAALEAKVAGKEAEFAAQQEAKRIQDEALASANERIKKAEIRALAAGKLNDPQDALRFLDLSEFEVDSDGNVSGDIAKAIEDLITSKPYLAAQGGKKFQGSADGGTRNDSGKPAQLTQADLASMSAEQIAEAHEKGQFSDLFSKT